jgi:hypothetical protein
MHRAGREVLERIEQSFRRNGFRPTQGAWGDPGTPNQRCGLAALLTPDQGSSPASHEIVASLIERSPDWVGFFVFFDEWPAANDRVFATGVYEEGEYDDR